MKRNILKAFVLRSVPRRIAFVLAAGVVAIMLNAGCEEQQQQPNSKMARLVAVENNQLKKDLQQRDVEIGKLKEQHGNELKGQQELLAKCQKEKEDLQEQIAGKFQGQIDNLMGSVAEESKQLREENESLKAQIETLKAELGKHEAQGEQPGAEPNEQKKPAEKPAEPL
jgi:hypothetical protein